MKRMLSFLLTLSFFNMGDSGNTALPSLLVTQIKSVEGSRVTGLNPEKLTKCYYDDKEIARLSEILLIKNLELETKPREKFIIERNLIRYLVDNEIVFTYSPERFEPIMSGSDVILNFAYFRGEIVIFWRETFQNRAAKYGLLSLGTSPEEMKLICSGKI